MTELRALERGLRTNDRDTLVQVFGCRESGQKDRLDLRGLQIDSLVLDDGNYALEGADLSRAAVGTFLADGAQMKRITLRHAELGTLRWKAVDFSNARLHDVTVRNDMVVEASAGFSTTWDSVFAAGAVFDSVQFLGGSLQHVVFDEGTLREMQLTDLEMSGVRLRATRVEDVSIRSSRVSRLSLEDARVDGLDVGTTHLFMPNLGMAEASSVRFNGTRVRRPIMSMAFIESVDLRPLIWEGFTLGNESVLTGRSHQAWRRNPRSTAQHRRVAQLYGRLANYYQNRSMPEYADAFYTRKRRFERIHRRPVPRVREFLLQEFPDKYGTSWTQLGLALVISWGVFAAAFVIGHLGAMLGFGGTWCTLRSRDGDDDGGSTVPGDAQSGRDTLFELLRGLGVSLLVAFESLLLFAEKLLNVEGLIHRVLQDEWELRGWARMLSVFASLWGVYLAVRGVIMLG